MKLRIIEGTKIKFITKIDREWVEASESSKASVDSIIKNLHKNGSC